LDDLKHAGDEQRASQVGGFQQLCQRVRLSSGDRLITSRGSSRRVFRIHLFHVAVNVLRPAVELQRYSHSASEIQRQFLPAQRWASAVLAVAVYLSVRLSVTSRSKKAERIELVLAQRLPSTTLC